MKLNKIFLPFMGISLVLSIAYIHQLKVTQKRLLDSVIIMGEQVELYEKELKNLVRLLQEVKSLYTLRNKKEKELYEKKRDEIGEVIKKIHFDDLAKKFERLRKTNSKTERQIVDDLTKAFEKRKKELEREK